MLSSGGVQEAHDFAAIAQAATLEIAYPLPALFRRLPHLHEVTKIELLDEDLRAMIDDALIREHRARALTPDRPVLRGTAQNPDVYFQGRETVNPFYGLPGYRPGSDGQVCRITGRQYNSSSMRRIPKPSASSS
jgi:pyruvate-ferredoxin/flavodoxin oxidoreductase